MDASGFGGSHACFGALGDKATFVFGEYRKLTEHHTPKRGAGVDALGEDMKIKAELAQIIEQRQQVQS